MPAKPQNLKSKIDHLLADPHIARAVRVIIASVALAIAFHTVPSQRPIPRADLPAARAAFAAQSHRPHPALRVMYWVPRQEASHDAAH